MKKGDRVGISDKYIKPSMRNSGFNWSEDVTGKTVLNEGTILYHVSVYDKLNGFAPITTCFDFEPALKSIDSYVYIARVAKCIEADTVDLTEVRIDLEKYTDSIEIYYAGTIERTGIEKFRKGTNISEGTLIKYNFHKNFKDLEEILNAKEKENFFANVKHYQEVR